VNVEEIRADKKESLKKNFWRRTAEKKSSRPGPLRQEKKEGKKSQRREWGSLLCKSWTISTIRGLHDKNTNFTKHRGWA